MGKIILTASQVAWCLFLRETLDWYLKHSITHAVFLLVMLLTNYSVVDSVCEGGFRYNFEPLEDLYL